MSEALNKRVTDASTPELIDDPVDLAAAYGLPVGPEWLRPEEHPDGTYGQPPAQTTEDTLAEAQETP